MSDILWRSGPQFLSITAKASLCLFLGTVCTFNAPVLDDLRKQFDALNERKPLMPVGVKPLRAGSKTLKSIPQEQERLSVLCVDKTLVIIVHSFNILLFFLPNKKRKEILIRPMVYSETVLK